MNPVYAARSAASKLDLHAAFCLLVGIGEHKRKLRK
jgi:hypothetical protein